MGFVSQRNLIKLKYVTRFIVRAGAWRFFVPFSAPKYEEKNGSRVACCGGCVWDNPNLNS